MAVPAERRLFTVDDYYRMAEVGLLKPDERVELIEGEIVKMTPIGPRHAGHVEQLADVFSHALGRAVHIRTQNPLRLGDRSEPEPDMMVLRRAPDFYKSRHPDPSDVHLLVEVADSSLVYDRQTKVPLYARHGIPEVWLVNLVERHIAVYRDPAPDGYRSVSIVRQGGTLRPLAFPDFELAVDEILG